MAETNGELTVEILRRRAVAAKSLLSRYRNERELYPRQSGSNIDEYSRLVEKEQQQEQKFRDAIRAWKAQEGKNG